MTLGGVTMSNKITGPIPEARVVSVQQLADFLNVSIDFIDHGNQEELILKKPDGSVINLSANGNSIDGGFFGIHCVK